MAGITLSTEQIRHAPPEVRRWLQQLLSDLLGFDRGEPMLLEPARHLVGCNVEEARSVLSLIHAMLPVVSVFFELGREPVAASADGVRALRLSEMVHHARLQTPDQVVACLRAVDEALQRVCGSQEDTLTALDGHGHCLVADVTARGIQALWQEIVATRQAVQPEAAAPRAAPRQVVPKSFHTNGHQE